ncbi:MAG: Cytochrome c oxidase polypeptide II [uncultured Acidimicrobiales bacterium]|uniref:Cytochrome c oxidase subunit 2 n=1 Tax=uncultured Acidimicrobiales bacterium TaxID=310071 RepID=A0A6J4I2R5_9ACTN|nr:MAG: Cytochrome c oxidase polypeptide II [uncultured Acidimicrobiales bacterium]
MPSRTRRMFVPAVATLGLLGSACGTQELPQNALDPQGPVARQLDNLWDPVFLVAVVVFFLVQGLVLYCLFKFRAKSDEDAPVQVHGNAKLELGWTVAPAMILAFIGFFTVATVFDINRRAEGEEVVQVNVIGHQWWWEYDYTDEGIKTANELHIPAGEPVQIALNAEDVMHNFWPPKLAGKVYAIPGRTNYMQIEADVPGEYAGQCAEYCGLSHANMRLKVIAHERADYDRWVADQKRPAATPAASDANAVAGAGLFGGQCTRCHVIEGVQGGEIEQPAPNLTHLASRTCFAGCMFEMNDSNLRRWLRNPPAEKPMNPDNNQGMPNLGLTEEQITQLIAYLNTLK